MEEKTKTVKGEIKGEDGKGFKYEIMQDVIDAYPNAENEIRELLKKELENERNRS